MVVSMVRKMRVLIVDDLAENIEYIKRLLESVDDYEVFSFQDPEEGLNWAKSNLFDLLLIDYFMEPITGIDFIRELRNTSDQRVPPILMISSADEKSMLPIALEAGATDFLERPIDRIEFSARVKNMLKMRDQQMQVAMQEATIEKVIHEATNELRLDQERYELAALASNDGLWDWELDRDYIYYSPRWCDMIGYRQQELLNIPTSWFNRVHAEDYDALQAAIQTHLLGQSESLNWEYRMRHRNGFYQWMHVRAIAVRNQDGSPLRLVGTQTDVTERKKLEQQLTYSAFHDTLTGLPNRSLLTERLQQAFFRYKRDADSKFALLFVDLDKFKAINDTYGHEVGDMLLQAVAERMANSVRESDTPARLAGDEFVILLSDIKDSENAMCFADRLLNKLSEPVMAGDKELHPGVSIGVCLAAERHKDFSEVLRDADVALYKAKTLGRSCAVLFDQSLLDQKDQKDSTSQTFALKDSIMQAIYHGEFAMFYQPIYSLKNRKIMGFEAYLRWNHPRYGMILPSDFISEAEESSSMQELGKFVVNTTFYQLSEWQKVAQEKIFMNINISGKQLYENDFIENLIYAAKQYQIRPADIIIDVNEATIMGSFEMFEIIIMRIKQHGFQVALDDYGIRQSSFYVLSAAPFDYIKIDRSLISQATKRGKSQKALDIISSLSQAMGVKIVYEGIETDDELELLKKESQFFVQGNLFCPPHDAKSFIEIINKAS
jgi:diguanylate cyclase (GGDEF)-like protein/PAS domain S-box-containing protein